MDASARITMVRCSTLLVEHPACRLLTDPWFGMSMRGLPVFRRPGLDVVDLPPLDAVLVSHLHPDHFDMPALRRMRPAPARVVVPPGSLAVLGNPSGLEWMELAPWETTALGATRVTAVPGPHTGPRPDEVNYVVEIPGWGRLFFGGDARFDGRVLSEVARRFAPFRVALLPVGGSRILGVRTVMGPEDAFRAAQILDAALTVPIHEGGIWMPVPPLSMHPGRARHLVRAFAGSHQGDRRVRVLREGESLRV